VLVDTLGLLLGVYVTLADVPERAGGKRLLSGLKPLQPRLALIYGDGGYSGEEFAQWCSAEGGWRLETIPPALQRLRAQGADQRIPDRGCYDPFDVEAPDQIEAAIFQTRSKRTPTEQTCYLSCG
jgi:transposase